MALTSLPKYSALELERRWLIGLTQVEPLSWSESWDIEDHYLDCGLLRLRHQKHLATGEIVWKIAKKYPSDSAFARPMTNLYLSEDEFSTLARLPHRSIKKTRHHIFIDDNRWALDVFQGELSGLAMAEIECESLVKLMAVCPPQWAVLEVTEDPFFSGGNLSRTNAADLLARLSGR